MKFVTEMLELRVVRVGVFSLLDHANLAKSGERLGDKKVKSEPKGEAGAPMSPSITKARGECCGTLTPYMGSPPQRVDGRVS